MKDKLGKKQNKLRWGGVKYRAVVPTGPHPCSGCSFYPSDQKCPTIGPSLRAYCSAREDGRDIIWVKEEDKHVVSN